MEKRILETDRGVIHCRKRPNTPKTISPGSQTWVGDIISQTLSTFWCSMACLCLRPMESMVAACNYQTVETNRKGTKSWGQSGRRDWRVSVPVSNFHPPQQTLSDESREQGCEQKWLVEQKDEQRKWGERGNALRKMSTITIHLDSHTFFKSVVNPILIKRSETFLPNGLW